MTTRDLLLSGGLITGGLGLWAFSKHKQKAAGTIARESFKRAMEHTKKAEMAARSLNKLRSISGNDVNIGQMNQDLQDKGLRDNAFYFNTSDYKDLVKNLMAKKLKGAGGTVAIGDDARALPAVAHELGHATNQRTGRMKRSILGVLAGGGLGLATALGTGIWSRRTINPRLEDAALITGLAGLGMATADFITNKSVYDEEAKATANAMDYLKQMKRSEKQLAMDKEVLDAALGTYESSKNYEPLASFGKALALGSTGYLLSKYLAESGINKLFAK